MAVHLLRRQAHTARADQAGIRRLKEPEGPAVRRHHKDVAVVLPPKAKLVVDESPSGADIGTNPTIMPRGSTCTTPPSPPAAIQRLPLTS